jgi:hypothetical protein
MLPDEIATVATGASLPPMAKPPVVAAETSSRRSTARRLGWQNWLSDQQESLWLRLAQLGTGWLPRPWLE